MPDNLRHPVTALCQQLLLDFRRELSQVAVMTQVGGLRVHVHTQIRPGAAEVRHNLRQGLGEVGDKKECGPVPVGSEGLDESPHAPFAQVPVLRPPGSR